MSFKRGRAHTHAGRTWRPLALLASMVLVLVSLNSVVLVSRPQGSSDVQSSGAPVVQRWENLPKAPISSGNNVLPQRPETSDLDEQTLDQSKQKPFVPEPNPPYDVEQDRSVYGIPPTGEMKSIPNSSRPNPEQPRVRPLAPDVISSSVGLDTLGGSSGGFVFAPPDPDIAAGPNHIVTVVNLTFAIYDKSTGVKVQQTTFATWFSAICGCTSVDLFDPHIAYDPQEGHWLMLVLLQRDTGSLSSYLLSVSQTSDPTGAWWNYNLNAKLNYSGTDTWADYPDVGFDSILSGSGGAVYITSNQFTFPLSTASFRTSVLNILPKSALYSGASFSYNRAYNHLNSDSTQAFTLRAAKTIGGSSTSEYMVNTRNSFSGANFVSLWRVNPTFPPTPVDWTLQASVTIGTYAIAPDATQPQQGCSSFSLVGTNDNRMYNAVWHNNRIYAAFTQAFNFGSGTVAAIRYLSINTSTNATEVNTVYGADGFHYYYPAIHPNDADDITFVFGRSNSGEFAGLHVTGRHFGFPTTEPSTSLQAGATCITGGRYGDFFGAARDPSDGSRIWVYGEWAKDVTGVSSDFDWGTLWGQTRYVPPTPPAPTPAVMRVERSTGNAYSDGAYFCGQATGCFNATLGADLAERINVSERVEPGHVVEPDPNQPKLYRKARMHSSGVISSRPGMTLNNAPYRMPSVRSPQETPALSIVSLNDRAKLSLALGVSLQTLILMRMGTALNESLSVSQLLDQLGLRLDSDAEDNRPLLALIGRVPVKATTENGPIHPGDLLVVSASHPGYAMRCADAKSCEGAEVGKALESGEGLVVVLVTGR